MTERHLAETVVRKDTGIKGTELRGQLTYLHEGPKIPREWWRR